MKNSRRYPKSWVEMQPKNKRKTLFTSTSQQQDKVVELHNSIPQENGHDFHNMTNRATDAFARYCGTTDTRHQLREELKPPESLDHSNLQHALPLSKLEPAPEKSEIYGVRIPNPWILSTDKAPKLQ
ncbi:hypothetical protein PIB30_081319 [Stylosanthes scabra]|uniref:Uncharacterized protein n=1 Tax=Stylosanthes scabra TaxID=79078 RepID=A0ABU6YQL9_9FABA|nr:hypothetical protein [Stylosanthes scabra]